LLLNTESTSTKSDPVVCKRCCACKQIKPVFAFHRRKGGDGYQYACKVCINTRGNDGSYAGAAVDMPAAVECLYCGAPAACNLDNPYWLNQYSDDMKNYHALCSERCFKRLIGIIVRAKRLLALTA
jgi:hypothetical protein